MDEKARRFKRVEKLFSPEPDLVAVEELADLIASRPVRSRIQERLKPVPEPGARVREKVPTILQKHVDKANFPIAQSYAMIQEEEPGKLIEITLRANSNDFGVMYQRDNEQRDYSYMQLTALMASPIIAAHREPSDGPYLVQFTNLQWNRRFEFFVAPNTNITFLTFRAVWEVETYR